VIIWDHTVVVEIIYNYWGTAHRSWSAAFPAQGFVRCQRGIIYCRLETNNGLSNHVGFAYQIIYIYYIIYTYFLYENFSWGMDETDVVNDVVGYCTSVANPKCGTEKYIRHLVSSTMTL